MNLTKQQLDEIKSVLNKYIPDAEIWLFGSRVDGTAGKYADLDVLIKMHEKIPLETLSKLREDFDNSDIPFKIDLVDWHRITEEFRKTVEQSGSLIKL